MNEPKTPNLGLNKIDRSSPSTTYFDLDKYLDQNWEKVDEGVATKEELEELRKAVGEINVPDASLTQKGKVQLSNRTDGTSETMAATEKAVSDSRQALLSTLDAAVNGWQIYNDITSLGLTHGLETMEAICGAMADKSELRFMKITTNTSTAYPALAGMLFVRRYTSYRIELRFITGQSSNVVREWIGYYDINVTPNFTGWKSLVNEDSVSSNLVVNSSAQFGFNYWTRSTTGDGVWSYTNSFVDPEGYFTGPSDAITVLSFYDSAPFGNTFAPNTTVTLSAEFNTTGLTTGSVYIEILDSVGIVDSIRADLNKGWHYKSKQVFLSRGGPFKIRMIAGPNAGVGTKAFRRIMCYVGTQKIPYNSGADGRALFQSVSDGKTAIAAAITGKGVVASGSDNFPSLAMKVNQITKSVSGYTNLSYSTGVINGSYSVGGSVPATKEFVVSILPLGTKFLSFISEGLNLSGSGISQISTSSVGSNFANYYSGNGCSLDLGIKDANGYFYSIFYVPGYHKDFLNINSSYREMIISFYLDLRENGKGKLVSSTGAIYPIYPRSLATPSKLSLLGELQLVIKVTYSQHSINYVASTSMELNGNLTFG